MGATFSTDSLQALDSLGAVTPCCSAEKQVATVVMSQHNANTYRGEPLPRVSPRPAQQASGRHKKTVVRQFGWDAYGSVNGQAEPPVMSQSQAEQPILHFSSNRHFQQQAVHPQQLYALGLVSDGPVAPEFPPAARKSYMSDSGQTLAGVSPLRKDMEQETMIWLRSQELPRCDVSTTSESNHSPGVRIIAAASGGYSSMSAPDPSEHRRSMTNAENEEEGGEQKEKDLAAHVTRDSKPASAREWTHRPSLLNLHQRQLVSRSPLSSFKQQGAQQHSAQSAPNIMMSPPAVLSPANSYKSFGALSEASAPRSDTLAEIRNSISLIESVVAMHEDSSAGSPQRPDDRHGFTPGEQRACEGKGPESVRASLDGADKAGAKAWQEMEC